MAATTRNLIKEIKDRFDEAVEGKTGWGKNEIKSLLDRIIIDVLSEELMKESL